MTNRETNPIITLPLLIAYIEALLPSLLKITEPDGNTQASDQLNLKSDSFNLLWVVKDEQHKTELRSQIDSLMSAQDKSVQSYASVLIIGSHIQTLAQLSQQGMKQRYELACFWLPALSMKQLQSHIPTLMRYRDLYAAHCLVALRNINMRAYGFSIYDITSELAFSNDANVNNVVRSEQDDLITLWQFNLYDYKRLPNWLNNKYWANPENWNKHRW